MSSILEVVSGISLMSRAYLSGTSRTQLYWFLCPTCGCGFARKKAAIKSRKFCGCPYCKVGGSPHTPQDLVLYNRLYGRKLTKSLLTKLFRYEVGLLYRKVKTHNTTKVGSTPKVMPDRYAVVSILGRYYMVHKLIYMMHYGTLPNVVDHKDRDTTNNLIDNLRSCTSRQNSQNKTVRNRFGYTGVNRIAGRYYVRIIDPKTNKRLSCGGFTTPVAAAKRYNEMAAKYYGEFANLNEVNNE